MRITEFDITLHGLLIFRSQLLHVRKHCSDFEESLAKLFLTEVEKDVDQKLQAIDISIVHDILCVSHKSWMAARAKNRLPRGN